MTPVGDHLKILRVLNAAVRRRCVVDFCHEKKIGSTTLYQATDVNVGNPSLRTLCRIVNALGYELSVRPKKGANGPMVGYPKPRTEDPAPVADAAQVQP